MKTNFIYAIIFLFTLAFGLTFNVTASAKSETNENSAREKLLYQGNFHNADKSGSGTASVYETKDGKRILRLTNFKTTKGPDLFVYVYKTNDASNTADLKNVEYISLGRLKSNKGNQEYKIPANVDLESFQALSIWCKEFGVNFATAPLSKA